MKKLIFFSFLFISTSTHALEQTAQINQKIQSDYEEMDYSIEEPFILLNPYNRNPLAALIKFKTEKEAQIEYTLYDKQNNIEIKHLFDEFKQEHEVPALALYPNHLNKISLTAYYKDNTSQKVDLSIKTNKVDKKALIIPLEKNDKDNRYHYMHGGLVFDEAGSIRLSFKPEYEMLYFFNNQFIAEDRNLGLITYNMLGEKTAIYTYPKNFTSFTHGLAQKPNKNFLILGSFKNKTALFENKEAQTQRDFIIEIDAKTKKHINTIDLAEILNPDRSVIIKSNTENFGLNNWCHLNGIDYDEKDSSILLSCRHVGMIKINERTKEPIFILSHHKGFEKSGRFGKGQSLESVLLTALDKQGKKLPETIQKGENFHPDFKWPGKTHDARNYKNGIYSIFDNAGLLYDKKIITTHHSNAHIFKIDEKNKTVQTLFFYPLPFYSESGSSVLFNPEYNDVSIYTSIIKDNEQKGLGYARLMRIDFKTHQKMFDALIYRGGETYFYGIQPFSFYPPKQK